MGLTAWLDAAAFAIRDRVPWSWPARCPGPSRLDDLDPDARAAADRLAARYDLGPLLAATATIERDESLYVLDLLDRWVDRPPAGARALDVGAKYGAYLPGLATFAPGAWDVIERDAHRRYVTGHTRRAVGEAIAARFAGCRYLAGDVRAHHGSYALVTWFLPFVVLDPHVAWGLPASLFDPTGTLAAVLRLVTPGGQLFVVNQGDDEADVQAALFASAGVLAERIGRIESDLSPFSRPRVAWRVRR